MAWIPITYETLQAYLVGAQLDAVETAALATGQTSPFDEVAPSIVSKIRSFIAGCASNILDPDPTLIPASLKDTAAALIIEAMQPRLLLELTDDQRRAADNARSYLRDIAACRVKVDDIETVGAFQNTGVGAELIRRGKCPQVQDLI